MPPSDARLREAAHALLVEVNRANCRQGFGHIQLCDAIVALITRERADADAGAWRESERDAEESAARWDSFNQGRKNRYLMGGWRALLDISMVAGKKLLQAEARAAALKDRTP